jgi:hypothetical protein
MIFRREKLGENHGIISKELRLPRRLPIEKRMGKLLAKTE